MFIYKLEKKRVASGRKVRVRPVLIHSKTQETLVSFKNQNNIKIKTDTRTHGIVFKICQEHKCNTDECVFH